MKSRTFRAMGTEIELFVDAKSAVHQLDVAEAEFHRLEVLLSRFREDSELSRLNRSGAIDASTDLVRIAELALAAREETEGRFDPTVHDAVVAMGYDRSFERVRDSDETPASANCGGGVRIRGSRIKLDDGVRLDFGGIGKGYAVERAVRVLATAGPCLVNAGGDLAVRGGSWPIGVLTSEGSLTLELDHGALATSGRDQRRWHRAGKEVHHLIDPATGTSATGDLVRTTVAAVDAIRAEVWAKALFLAGTERAAVEADARGLPCVLITTDGETLLAGGLG